MNHSYNAEGLLSEMLQVCGLNSGFRFHAKILEFHCFTLFLFESQTGKVTVGATLGLFIRDRKKLWQLASPYPNIVSQVPLK